jgi:predicted nucleotidyltransferase component of viral defense system
VTGDRLLKIETSFRTSPDASRVTMIDGIRTYTIDALIEQKTDALTHRTAARDLFDIAFLAKTYFNEFSPEIKTRLSSLIQDIDALEQRFQDAFEEDEILETEDLSTLILQLSNSLSL